WAEDLRKRIDADQDVAQELLIGADLVGEAAEGAPDDTSAALEAWATRLRKAGGAPLRGSTDAAQDVLDALDEPLAADARRWQARRFVARYPRVLPLQVDRPLGRTGAWYEFFPRSTGPDGRHGTFADAEAHLPYVAELGFDVIYLPPIHPIGRTARKGPNNRTSSGPADPGSPWAIGAAEGGHTAVHPDLGTLEDFQHFRARAEALGLEVALDIAFQCSPDHPWVEEHPQWFRHRPDGSIRTAENPPKRYEDIYPFDFETEDWRALWEALRDVFLFWVEQGVRVFRVDNPHTKPFPFWEWCIAQVREQSPDVLFLSEAFTRPKVMHTLAKLGFSQSYTYFAWRNSAAELQAYMEELTTPPTCHYFRPAFWPNTPDILTEYLQTGGRGAYTVRLVLAGTLASTYGIYGPAFELLEHRPREPESEEYLDSEKYQVRDWDLERPESLRELVRLLNRIRHENPALQSNERLLFHDTDDEHVLAFSKRTPDGSNRILVVVNVDPHHAHAAHVDLRPDAFGLDADTRYRAHDLLGGGRFQWPAERAWVHLDPAGLPAHIFRLKPYQPRDETHFDYFV
ncbi:MAG: DUF3416 domain-containing protein, partial [Gemmatimonadetes bacterium]|nr:DUF3416 domain-containing protein [Gemmatimonadota bacterium]